MTSQHGNGYGDGEFDDDDDDDRPARRLSYNQRVDVLWEERSWARRRARDARRRKRRNLSRLRTYGYWTGSAAALATIASAVAAHLDKLKGLFR